MEETFLQWIATDKFNFQPALYTSILLYDNILNCEGKRAADIIGGKF